MNENIPEELTILVVDDDPIIRTLLEKLLSKSYKVWVAENGLQALEIIQANKDEIVVVLSDVHMPLLDGLGLLKRIKTEYPGICVVMLSGNSDIQIAVQAMRQGAHDYIAKPFTNMEELDLIIGRWYQYQSLETKLDQYVNLHRNMMRNMKARTFVAIDAVDSRRIKKDEDPFLVQYSFAAYHEFVEKIVEEHAGEIHSTAGDGIMACFVLPSSAVTAAEQILSELESFNLERNQLSGQFGLRIGVHTGSVILGENGRISEMFSESLDIAGHIQKDAGSNSIAISETTQENLIDNSRFSLTGKSIDNLAIYSISQD